MSEKKEEKKRLTLTTETIAYLNTLPEGELRELVTAKRPQTIGMPPVSYKDGHCHGTGWSFDSCPTG
jgi:hypothetical protein